MEDIINSDLINLKNLLKTNFKAKESKKFVKKFETEFSKKFNCKYGIACCNGTATLHGILMGMNIGNDDEVITTPLTMSATSLSILHSGAIPVFADVDKDTFQIDPKSIVEKITEKTKAIMVVSLYGLSPEMDEIMDIAKKYNLYVIEDNAECFLGEYKGRILGSIGDASSFSFQNTKHMTTGEGGMILTNNIILQDKIAKATVLGYQTVGELARKFEVTEFRDPNFDRHISYGFNYRMSELCAAVGLNRLNYLEKFVKIRIEVAKKFEKVINDSNCNWLIPQKVNNYIKHVYWGYSVKIGNDITFNNFRDKFISNGGRAPYAAWKLTYLEPYFYNKKFSKNQSQDFRLGLCPNAEDIQSKIISFQNNYNDIDDPEIEKQLEALRKTILYFQKRIIGVIYCRLGSTRLPNKALKKLNKVESIKRTIFNSLQMKIDDLVIATGDKNNNHKLEKIRTDLLTQYYDIPIYYGNENNLFERTQMVIDKLRLNDDDYILRLTGDDVCRSYEIANHLINFVKNSNESYDYITNYPSDCAVGLGSEIMSVRSLKYFNRLIKEPNEHLTCYYLFFRKILKIKIIKLDPKYSLNSTITLDDENDYVILNNFFQSIKLKEGPVSFKKIKKYFENFKSKEISFCMGETPDITLSLLNYKCSKYPGFSSCQNIDLELKRIFLKDIDNKIQRNINENIFSNIC